MMLKEEKHTKSAVSFKIDLGSKQHHEVPEIKKKLEAQAAHGPSITLDQISKKLMKAEEKRK